MECLRKYNVWYVDLLNSSLENVYQYTCPKSLKSVVWDLHLQTASRSRTKRASGANGHTAQTELVAKRAGRKRIPCELVPFESWTKAQKHTIVSTTLVVMRDRLRKLGLPVSGSKRVVGERYLAIYEQASTKRTKK